MNWDDFRAYLESRGATIDVTNAPISQNGFMPTVTLGDTSIILFEGRTNDRPNPIPASNVVDYCNRLGIDPPAEVSAAAEERLYSWNRFRSYLREQGVSTMTDRFASDGSLSFTKGEETLLDGYKLSSVDEISRSEMDRIADSVGVPPPRDNEVQFSDGSRRPPPGPPEIDHIGQDGAAGDSPPDPSRDDWPDDVPAPDPDPQGEGPGNEEFLI